jgi:hypothetical protein
MPWQACLSRVHSLFFTILHVALSPARHGLAQARPCVFPALRITLKHCKIVELLLSDIGQKQFRVEKLQLYFQSVSIKHDLNAWSSAVLTPKFT